MGITRGVLDGLPWSWAVQKGLPAKLGHFGAITLLYSMKSLWPYLSGTSIWKSTWKEALGTGRWGLAIPCGWSWSLSSPWPDEGPLGAAEGYLARFC